MNPINVVMAVVILCVLFSLGGCQVNVVVAPHATFAVDSLNNEAQALLPEAYDYLPDELSDEQ